MKHVTLERAKEITAKFKDQKVLLVGDAMLDHYVLGVVQRVNPEAPVPLLNVRETRYMTGGAGNASKNVAKLGAATTLLTITGDDPGAFRLREIAEEEGYSAYCIRDASRPTIQKSRFMANNQQLLRVDQEEKHIVSAEIEEQIIADLKKFAADVTAIIVSDYDKGFITPKIAATVLEVAKEHNIPIIADLKANHVGIFKGVTAITPNRKEAHEFLKLNWPDEKKEPAELAKNLFELMGSDVFVTLGDEGIYIRNKDGEEAHIDPAKKIEVFDVSGAGDTVAAVLALSYASGATAFEAGELANSAGAVVVSQVGSVALTTEELLEMISTQENS